MGKSNKRYSIYEVSSFQKFIYHSYLKEESKNKTKYNILIKINFKDDVNISKLKNNIQKIYKFYEILRAKFIAKNNSTIFYIIDKTIKKIKFKNYSKENISEFNKAFDLSQGPLIKVGFFEDKVLMICIHRIIADETTVNILVRELINYGNDHIELDSTIQFSDYMVNYHKEMENESNQIKLLKSKFNCEYNVLSLPNKKIKNGNNLMKCCSLAVGEEHFKILNSFIKSHNILPKSLFLCIYGFIISKYSESEIVYTSIFNEKRNGSTKNIIGELTDIQPVLIKFDKNVILGDILKEVNKDVLIYESSNIFFSEVSKRLNLKKVNNMFTFHSYGSSQNILNDIFKNDGQIFSENDDCSFLSNLYNFGIVFKVTEEINQYVISINYNDLYFDNNIINNILDSYFEVINNLNNMDIKIGEIEYLPPVENNKTLKNSNDNKNEQIIKGFNQEKVQTFKGSNGKIEKMSNDNKHKVDMIKKHNRKEFRKKFINKKIILNVIIIVLYFMTVIVNTFTKNSKSLIDKKTGLIFTQGNSRKDKYGIELNKYIINGTYHQALDNLPFKSIKDWSLYTPQCPHLQPIHYPKNITEPNCEESSLQFVNFSNLDLPYSLPLHDISNLFEKFKQWKEKNNSNPYIDNKNISELLDDSYHPYDYGYDYDYDYKNSTKSDTKYYRNLIKSRMDETPDPRKRRLFSFILFNAEFDLLDIYLSENYEIIDYFVIFESNSTILGQPKPLYFTKMLLETNRYKLFKDKIIPIPYTMPLKNENKDVTKEDILSKVVIEQGLRAVQARHGDLFIYGLVNEMAKPHVLARLKKCGGWEHLHSGIGGGPYSYLNKDKSSITNEKSKSIAFLSRSYGYSFQFVKNNIDRKDMQPNLSIFDARLSLGQLSGNNSSDNTNDPLSEPNFDPYQGYKNFTITSDDALNPNNKIILWNASWKMNFILPTLNHIYNEYISLKSNKNNKLKIKYYLKKFIEDKVNIINKDETYVNNIPVLPEGSLTNDYSYNFDYMYWKSNSAFPHTKNFEKLIHMLKNEIPQQVYKNSICYSYMLERDFGLNKKMWWEIIPRNKWSIVKFDKLEHYIKSMIKPWIYANELDDISVLNMEETLEELIKNRKSISRFGDGEYNIALNNKTWRSSNFQRKDKKLSERLSEVLMSDEENFLVGVPNPMFDSEYLKLRTNSSRSFWTSYNKDPGYKLLKLHDRNKVYGSAMITRFYLGFEDKSRVGEYVQKLRKLWDNREILIVEGEKTRIGVGNDLLANAKSIERILCPARNAFKVYDKIYQEVLKHDKNKLVLISLGQTATVLAYDLYKEGYQAIDFGHGDIEYEWYLRNATIEIRIDNKFVNEVRKGKGRVNIEDEKDENYLNQIVAKILR